MDFHIEAGLSHWQAIGDGTTWYQQGMPYSDKLTTPTIAIGINGERWRIGVVDLGRTSVDAQALTEDRPGYKGYATGVRTCAKDTPCAHFQGHGGAIGPYAEYAIYQTHGIKLWAGVAALRTSWTEDVSKPYYDGMQKMQPMRITMVDSSYGPYHLEHKPNWSISPVLGVTYDVSRHVYAGVWGYFGVDAKGDAIPSYARGPVVTATIGVRF